MTSPAVKPPGLPPVISPWTVYSLDHVGNSLMAVGGMTSVLTTAILKSGTCAAGTSVPST